jgi:hypothetical protein
MTPERCVSSFGARLKDAKQAIDAHRKTASSAKRADGRYPDGKSTVTRRARTKARSPRATEARLLPATRSAAVHPGSPPPSFASTFIVRLLCRGNLGGHNIGDRRRVMKERR